MESTIAYINHSLNIAGAKHELFLPEAIHTIHRYSRGIPRLINVICDNCLLEAFLLKKKSIGQEVVEGVANDLCLPKATLAAGGSKPPPQEEKTVPPPPGPLSDEESDSLGMLGEHDIG